MQNEVNVMKELQENCDNISKKIKQIGLENNSHYVIDGIINPAKYLKAKHKILWILKEANSNDTWSYSEKFQNESWLYQCGKSVPTLKRIIYTTYGILNECDWSEIPDAKDKKAFKPLQEIALINIKKIPGGSSSSYNEIQTAYDKHKELLREQIKVYNPDIVIFGNTLNFFQKEDFEGLKDAKKEITEYRNHFYNTGNRLYIHTWHPAVRGAGFTDKGYVMDIVNIVKDNFA